jgi:hypothetical protein
MSRIVDWNGLRWSSFEFAFNELMHRFANWRAPRINQE